MLLVSQRLYKKIITYRPKNKHSITKEVVQSFTTKRKCHPQQLEEIL